MVKTSRVLVTLFLLTVALVSILLVDVDFISFKVSVRGGYLKLLALSSGKGQPDPLSGRMAQSIVRIIKKVIIFGSLGGEFPLTGVRSLKTVVLMQLLNLI